MLHWTCRPAHRLLAYQLSSCKAFHETTALSAVDETPLQYWRLVILLARCISFVLGVVAACGSFIGDLRNCKVLQGPPYALGCVHVRHLSNSPW